jgi:hypothetical protein
MVIRSTRPPRNPFQFAHRGRCFVDVAEHDARRPDERLAGVAEHHAATDAVKQRHPQLMSECRALVNFIGNAVATLFVAKWNHELDVDRARQYSPARTFRLWKPNLLRTTQIRARHRTA